MAEAKQRHAWSIGSAIIATIINVNGGKDGRAVEPDQFNPFAKPADSHEAIFEGEIATARDLWKSQYG